MRVQLATQPQFLRTRFSPIRSYLSGTVQIQAGQTAEVVIFESPAVMPSSVVISPELSPPAPPNTIVSPILSTKRRAPKSGWSKLSRGLTITAMLIASVVGLGVGLPYAYYKFAPVDVVPVMPETTGTPLGGNFEEKTATPSGRQYQPPRDETLPEGQWIVIPRIGVRTELQATVNPEEALNTGVWRVPDFAAPGEFDKPMILAAHRYGWQWWWQTDYWKYHSFYLLPDLKPGDTVEVIADQRKWVYEIYAGEEGGDITDYQADLILYTCKFLNSPVRHFRYARVIDPTKNTQS